MSDAGQPWGNHGGPPWDRPPGPPREDQNGPPRGGQAGRPGEDQAGRPGEDQAGRPGDDRGEAEQAALRARVAELEDQRLRALADLDNLRKRCARDVARAHAEERFRVVREWLPVLDNLDRALAQTDADPAAIVEGVRAVRDQAAAIVARLGFPRRDDLGEIFDPSRHDAIGSRSDTDAQAGTVIEVLQPGYGSGDHQLRPALVVVAKGD
jgi:molecular chaperone GrpE